MMYRILASDRETLLLKESVPEERLRNVVAAQFGPEAVLSDPLVQIDNMRPVVNVVNNKAQVLGFAAPIRD